MYCFPKQESAANTTKVTSSWQTRSVINQLARLSAPEDSHVFLSVLSVDALRKLKKELKLVIFEIHTEKTLQFLESVSLPVKSFICFAIMRYITKCPLLLSIQSRV